MNANDQHDGLLRLSQIIGRKATPTKPAIPPLIPVSRSSFLAGVRSGFYPASLRLGARCTVWRESQIRALIQNLGADAVERVAIQKKATRR